MGQALVNYARKGAETSVYLASSPDIASVTRGYFSNSKPARMAKKAKDKATAGRLWDVSLAMAGLSSPATNIKGLQK